MEQTISNYNELIDCIKSNNLTVEQSIELISLSYKLWITKPYSNINELLIDFEKHHNTWKNYKGETPLFMNDDFSINHIYNNENTPYPKRYI
jgi:hypothetical protein